jgi:hypothetical protein
MSDLQHQRIVELCQELRLSAMPNLYSGIAQSAAAKEVGSRWGGPVAGPGLSLARTF